MGGFIDMQQLHDELLTQLVKTLTPMQMKQLEPHLAPLIQNAAQAVAEDLIAYAYRDPASRGRGELILESYASFKAVLSAVNRRLKQVEGEKTTAAETPATAV